MEFEEIIKKVQWLDDQERKSKSALSDLGGRLEGLDTSITGLARQLKGIEQRLNDLSVAAARIEQFDQILAKHRAEMARSMETAARTTARREQETAKAHEAEMEGLRKAVADLRSGMAAEETTRKERGHEEQRRAAQIQDIAASVESAVRVSQAAEEAGRRLEEARGKDAKRMADLQAELSSVRKRAEESREKTALHNDNLRNLENRITELMETEGSRQERHKALLHQQALQQVERDRTWKEFQEKYEAFKGQVGGAASQVAAFDDAIRAANQSQEAYDGLNQRLERRIAELGEVQRLADERIRQEWIAFKADEQKRWSGHSLSQDEILRELRKDLDKIEQRVAAIDDASLTMQDQLQQTTEATERQLQELMNISQDWLSAYERIMGHSTTKVKKEAR